MMYFSRRFLGLRLPLFLFLACIGSSVQAQFSALIPESQLMAPWEQHLAVLKSMETAIVGLQEETTKSAVVDALFALEPRIGEYESEVGEVINRLAGDPQFAYVAGDVSLVLSQRLDEVYAQLDNLHAALGSSEREDVIAAQASLEKLRGVLKMKRPFDVDVVNALGSGSRQVIVALATRWWHGEEKAAELREYVVTLRQGME